MFRISDSFRVLASKFWLLVLGLVSCIFSLKTNKFCDPRDQIDKNSYKRGENFLEFVNKEEGFEVDNGEVNKTGGETEHSIMASSTSKYEIMSGKHINGFIEAPKSLTVSVEEFYIESNDFNTCDETLAITGEEVVQPLKAEDSVEKVLNEQEEISSVDTVEVLYQEKTEDSVSANKETCSSVTPKLFALGLTEDSVSVDNALEEKQRGLFSEDERKVFTEFKFLPKYGFSDEVLHLSEDWLSPVDSQTDTNGSSDDDFELDSYEFLAERNFIERFGCDSFEATSEEEEGVECKLNQEECAMTDVTFDSDDDYIELSLELHHGSSVLKEPEEEDLFGEEAKAAESHRLSETSQLENSNSKEDEYYEEDDLVYEASELGHKGFLSGSDDDDESASEHDDLIEQLKMELKNARTGGLPTILEESESPPKTVKELKPLKINQKFEHKDHMKEIHTFHRSYLEKMRKLDILNSTTMHAVGLLRREPGQSSKESSIPAKGSLLLPNLWPRKPRRSEANPASKFNGDLHKDFELVYVGQICLSWEILHWQYRKALELQQYDTHQLCQYNQIAGEFQNFQVLLQRFIENEPFQECHRVQNYVNNRCARSNFLQVPAIKDDKKPRKEDEEDSITSPMLTTIIEESMQLYWDFLHADKHEDGINSRGPELQDSADSELLSDIRTDFQKKEKKLKAITRSNCCIVKKLQKQHDTRFHGDFFFAQIELKLISRVIAMSKLTTDQLIWCHEKLAKINFWHRKLVLEPSLLLFPC